MWLAPDGKRFASPLVAPVELHGGMDRYGELLWIEVEGKRLHVKRPGIRYVLYDELGHAGVSGSARCVEMDDGSYWVCVRDLHAMARWIGERVEPRLSMTETDSTRLL